MMKDILFFTYRLLSVNSVSGIKSTIQRFPLPGYLSDSTGPGQSLDAASMHPAFSYMS